MAQLKWLIDLGHWPAELSPSRFADQVFHDIQLMNNPGRAELQTMLRDMGKCGMWWHPPGNTAKEVGIRAKGLNYPWTVDTSGGALPEDAAGDLEDRHGDGYRELEVHLDVELLAKAELALDWCCGTEGTIKTLGSFPSGLQE